MNQSVRSSRLGLRLLAVLPATAVLAVPELTLACSRCFGMGVDNATTQGITFAMLGLLLMLGVVWGGIGAFAVRVRRRSRLLEPGDWTVNDDGEVETRDEADPTDQIPR